MYVLYFSYIVCCIDQFQYLLVIHTEVMKRTVPITLTRVQARRMNKKRLSKHMYTFTVTVQPETYVLYCLQCRPRINISE